MKKCGKSAIFRLRSDFKIAQDILNEYLWRNEYMVLILSFGVNFSRGSEGTAEKYQSRVSRLFNFLINGLLSTYSLAGSHRCCQR